MRGPVPSLRLRQASQGIFYLNSSATSSIATTVWICSTSPPVSPKGATTQHQLSSASGSGSPFQEIGGLDDRARAISSLVAASVGHQHGLAAEGGERVEMHPYRPAGASSVSSAAPCRPAQCAGAYRRRSATARWRTRRDRRLPSSGRRPGDRVTAPISLWPVARWMRTRSTIWRSNPEMSLCTKVTLDQRPARARSRTAARCTTSTSTTSRNRLRIRSIGTSRNRPEPSTTATPRPGAASIARSIAARVRSSCGVQARRQRRPRAHSATASLRAPERRASRPAGVAT